MTVHYNQLGSIIPGLLSGFAGYNQARNQNRAIGEQNALAREVYERDKAIQQPIVEGAGNLIRSPGNFSPFVESSRNIANQAQQTASGYGANVTPYQEAGLEGVGALRNLGRTATAQNLLSEAGNFFNPYAEARFRLGADEINRQAEKKAKELAIASSRNLTPLSSQAARQQAFNTQLRDRNLANLGTQIGGQAYDAALNQARQLRQDQTGLAQNLVGLGTTGLNQAVTAQQLGQSAGQSGIQAPFLPFQTYGRTVSGTGLSAPSINPLGSPFGAGVGGFLAGYGSPQKNTLQG